MNFRRKNNIIYGISTILIVMLFCINSFAQNDSIRNTDNCKPGAVVFKSQFLKSSTDLTDQMFFANNYKIYNPKLYKSLNNYNLFFSAWVNQYYPSENYTQYALRYQLFNKYGHYNDFNYNNDPTNPSFNPTNPAGATNAGDALILGSLNYILYKLILDE